jgi:hypothetical protein
MGFRKERPARSYGKTGASWFCESWRCPRALVKLWNSLNHFYFLKREGGQAICRSKTILLFFPFTILDTVLGFS